MPLSNRSKARVHLEAGFIASLAADAALLGMALPIGSYFFGAPVKVNTPLVVAGSLVCFGMALLLLVIAALWLGKVEDE
jgi:hypothetical protein